MKTWTWGDFGDERITVEYPAGEGYPAGSFHLTGRWPTREEREAAIIVAERICATMNERAAR